MNSFIQMFQHAYHNGNCSQKHPAGWRICMRQGTTIFCEGHWVGRKHEKASLYTEAEQLCSARMGNTVLVSATWKAFKQVISREKSRTAK